MLPDICVVTRRANAGLAETNFLRTRTTYVTFVVARSLSSLRPRGLSIQYPHASILVRAIAHASSRVVARPARGPS